MKGLGADGPYWEALNNGHIALPQCADCGRWHWPAVWRCGQCGSWEHQWHTVTPHGTVFSHTRCWYDFGAPKELIPPYTSVVVELDHESRIRLMGTLPPDSPEPAIGSPVSASIITVHIDNEPVPALRWTLAAGGAS